MGKDSTGHPKMGLHIIILHSQTSTLQSQRKMKKSNIFAFIELTKLVDGLKDDRGKLKQKLKSQSAYFNIIEPRYFSDTLVEEWESILAVVKQKGAKVNEEGRIVSNAVSNTIDHLSDGECELVVERVNLIYDQVRKEFQ